MPLAKTVGLKLGERQMREIRGNEIVRPGDAGIAVSGARDVTIADNVIEGYGDLDPIGLRKQVKEPPFGAGHAVVLENVHGLKMEKNRFVEPGERAAGEVAERGVSAGH